MFLRKTPRKKDGKTHDYWSVVENRRVASGRVVQRHVLYLGEINSSQAAVWRKAIEVLDDDAGHPRTMALFPEHCCTGVAPDASVVQLRLSDMRLCRPRQWGACWLVGADFGLAEAHKLYACHDLLQQHKEALFSHLMARWRDLFHANFDVLLYDLTSTYFEINASDVAEGDKRRHGYSRDKRPDCPQVVIALVVTPDGLPLAYEVLPGNTAFCTTLRMFLARIEQQYGRARRVWVMDRGIPTEAVLAEMRGSDPPVQYLVGTPKSKEYRLMATRMPLIGWDRMYRLFLLAAPAFFLQDAALFAAGQFDGAYSGHRTSLRGAPPNCTKEGATTLQVKDGVFKLTYGRAHFDTEVKADGSFEKTVMFDAGRINVNATLRGHIANRTLEADLETYACKYHYALNRK